MEGLTRQQVKTRLAHLRLRLKRTNQLDGDGNLISPSKVNVADTISAHELFLLHGPCVDSVQARPAQWLCACARHFLICLYKECALRARSCDTAKC